MAQSHTKNIEKSFGAYPAQLLNKNPGAEYGWPKATLKILRKALVPIPILSRDGPKNVQKNVQRKPDSESLDPHLKNIIRNQSRNRKYYNIQTSLGKLKSRYPAGCFTDFFKYLNYFYLKGRMG